jgi:hypothetical protein
MTFKDNLARIKAMKPGDPVTNICAGESNPIRLGKFVCLVEKSRENKWGIVHTSRWAKMKDSNGNLHNIDIEVVYAGHLDYAECQRLFAPVWDKRFGTNAA